MDPRLELLGKVPLFAGLDPGGLAAVAAITEDRDFPAGHVLTHEGRHEGYFYLVISGTARVNRGGQTINVLRDGDFLGEISLLVMTHQRFWQLLDEAPEVKATILEEVGRRLRLMDAEAAH